MARVLRQYLRRLFRRDAAEHMRGEPRGRQREPKAQTLKALVADAYGTCGAHSPAIIRAVRGGLDKVATIHDWGFRAFRAGNFSSEQTYMK